MFSLVTLDLGTSTDRRRHMRKMIHVMFEAVMKVRKVRNAPVEMTLVILTFLWLICQV